jgi:hypothetical protein
MDMVVESYRGLSVVFELALDRILVPLAILVAMVGAGMIGLQLVEMFGLDAQFLHRL